MTLLEMLQNRLPDEAALFAASLSGFLEEAQALAGFEGTAEVDLSVLQKSLVADMAAKAMILPAMSKYKTSLAKAEGDGSGSAEFVDKLKFLTEMKHNLNSGIVEKMQQLAKADDSTDTGVPMIVV